MRITRTLAAVSALAVLTACGSDGDDKGGDATTTAEETSEATAPADGPSDEPTDDAPPFPAETATQTAKPSGEWDLVLQDVRVGSHDGFDRVVLEFAGTGTPGWAVGYVDEPVADGSGEPLPVDGESFLDVYASGTTYPAEGEGVDLSTIDPGSGELVAGVRVVGTFEGDTQVVVGLDGDAAPFRTFALTEPARLVVDVAHEAA